MFMKLLTDVEEPFQGGQLFEGLGWVWVVGIRIASGSAGFDEGLEVFEGGI